MTPNHADNSNCSSNGATTTSGSIPPASAPNAQEYRDCLPCKLVGAGAMTGVAGYALHARSELDPARFPARRKGLLGLSLAFLG
ncbi:hypothetical protein FB639_000286 [Coemansia asiatica]|nr:hypothetical protein FB639_000286 [Coemansia asiatica]